MLSRVLEPEVMDSAEEASEYDAMDHTSPNAAFVERLVKLGAHGRMLDIGTGPGQIPLLVCEKIPGASVVGIDLSRHMLELAEKKRRASPHAAQIEFQFADAKKLGFPDASFDSVFSNTILHHIPDPRPFVAEAVRVLKPGGVLVIRDLFRPPVRGMLDRIVQTYAGTSTPRQRALYAASLHAALTPGELQDIADELNMTDAQVVIDSDRHMSLQIGMHR